MLVEEWRDISGFEGLYQISNQGRVMSFCCKNNRNGYVRKAVPDKDGYMTILLKKDGKYYGKKVHRLVAEAFIENPEKYEQINHKDENKANNVVDNLEWCSCLYNQLYHDKYKKSCKAIIQIDKEGHEVARFNSIDEASRKTGILSSCISAVLHQKRKTTGGFKWVFLL